MGLKNLRDLRDLRFHRFEGVSEFKRIVTSIKHGGCDNDTGHTNTQYRNTYHIKAGSRIGKFAPGY